ncbi:VPLPA-CTERM sorting domain-containing protein [Peristeroidobacter soli]|jgi:hypothetical protein|uniref:VPLPA-CTERM sorting domain-containing protein n=1 Tax=Peristeroidobacter soli TaxID=2497877 RepID=UPI00101C22CA|nr:VPLPA-CTERM sorting domain-containing protein [Peristeroidobacter soli]
MKFSLKQIVAASTLLAASTAALADVTVPAGYGNSATAPAGFTTNTDTDGGVVFHLFNTGDTILSVSYYLGLDLSEFTFDETNQAGLSLSWTINPATYAGADLSQMQWGVVAGDNGSQNTAGSTRLLSTVANGSVTNLINTNIITAAALVDNSYNGANEDDSPLDRNTLAGTRDTRAVLGNFGIAGFDWTADASDADATLAMYLYAQNGGRNQGNNPTIQTQYAGVWSFDAATGVLNYSVAAAPVPLPAAAWLLLSALGGLGAVSRRRVAA